VIYVNTGDTGNMSPTGGTNTGNVHFTLLPWGAGPVETVDAGTAPVSFQQFGLVVPAQVNWPLNSGQWNAHANSFSDSSSNHVCLQAQIQGFLQDSIAANDSPPQVNLAYATMSTIRDKFLIHALGTSSPGAPKEDYVVKLHWNNLNKGQAKDPDAKECWLRRLCDRINHRKYWQGRFVNGNSIGLKPLGRGTYGLKLAPGEQVTAELELTGAVMPTPSQLAHVSPRAGGQAISPASGDPAVVVPVISGGMVTIVAQGLLSIHSNSVVGSNMHNAWGFADPSLNGSTFLLPSRSFPSWLFAGALIGAFKPDFSDAFLIGPARTYFVTPGATQLYLAINDVAGAYGDNIGPGLDINVVSTPPTTLPTKLSWPGDAKLGLPAVAQPGANMPTFTVDVVKVDAAKKLATPVGSVSYGVYFSHEENGGNVGQIGNNPRNQTANPQK